jgi:glutamate formiminotransferase/formiminotetrahydrofolate cyclodeaminase
MTLMDLPLHELLAAIRDPRPTPGGGSAAAIAGALGASLLVMVASMTKHRAVSEEDVERLQGAASRCAELGRRLESLVDEDSAAYGGVMAAYRLPRGSDAEKAERRGRIQAALVAAIETPLEVMRQSNGAIEAAATVARFGNPSAASDVGVALELLAAAGRGARLNVEINLASLDDQSYVSRVRETISALDAEALTGAAAARAALQPAP